MNYTIANQQIHKTFTVETFVLNFVSKTICLSLIYIIIVSIVIHVTHIHLNPNALPAPYYFLYIQFNSK